MQHLFIYGTLLFPELVEKLTGKRFYSIPAILKGYKRFAVKGCDYPAIIADIKFDVHGVLLLNVDEKSMGLLTYYEGRDYVKSKVEVISEKQNYDAVAFVWANDIAFLEDFDWNHKSFKENSLSFYIDRVAPETEREFRESGSQV